MMALVIGTFYGLYLPVLINWFLTYNPVIKYYVYYVLSFMFFMNALVSYRRCFSDNSRYINFCYIEFTYCELIYFAIPNTDQELSEDRISEMVRPTHYPGSIWHMYIRVFSGTPQISNTVTDCDGNNPTAQIFLRISSENILDC